MEEFISKWRNEIVAVVVTLLTVMMFCFFY